MGHPDFRVDKRNFATLEYPTQVLGQSNRQQSAVAISRGDQAASALCARGDTIAEVLLRLD